MEELFSVYNKKKQEIKSRLYEFKNKNKEDIFYELCFCILTPASNGKRCDEAVNILKGLNFHNAEINPKSIIKKKTRFHNHKTRYLLNAKKKFPEIKNILAGEKDQFKIRDFLIKNINGLGLKESSHFLRNIGYENLAILDRHILKNLKKFKVINQIPKTLTRKKYLGIEKRFKNFSQEIKIPMDELDLLFWSMETGEVFK